jgi:secretory phospholipase A2
VLFILSIAVRFGDCENNTIDHNTECENIKECSAGTDEAALSSLENVLNDMKKIGSMFGKNKTDSQSKEAGSYGSILEKFKEKVRFIYPGTRWCGDGDDAKNKDDLGRFNDTDACCRAHDNCNNDILSGETKCNLKNNGAFTKSTCACDQEFYECLKMASGLPSYQIGKSYFNLLRPQCFKCICPTDNCKIGDGTDCKDHCTKYEWDNNRKF